MVEIYKASREALAGAVERQGGNLESVDRGAGLNGVRFSFLMGPVTVRGELSEDLTFEIEALDERSGRLFEATHRLRSPSAMHEILSSAIGQVDYHNHADLNNLDWGLEGVPWWDSSKDEFLARSWLDRPGRLPADNPAYDDVDDRIRELTMSDLDPERGWRLVKNLVELASTDDQLWRIGSGPLDQIAHSHGNLVAHELKHLYFSDSKWRKTFDGQISIALFDFRKQWERENESAG